MQHEKSIVATIREAVNETLQDCHDTLQQEAPLPGIRVPSDVSFTQLLPQLGYLHERIIDCLSAALDRVQPLEARYHFSLMLVKHARAFRERPEEATEIVPLVPIEAIANQLYILAINDWRVFLALLEPVYATIFPVSKWARQLTSKTLAREAGEVDLAYLRAANDFKDLRACLRLLEPADTGTVQRARREAYLLMETAHCLHAESAAAA